MPYPRPRWLAGIVVHLLVLCAAPAARADDCSRIPARLSWGPVQVGPNQDLHLNVAYAPPPRSGSLVRPPIRIRVEFELYRADSSSGAPGTVRLTFVERRVTDLTLAPGEGISVGGEMISGYAASHLSLLGPTGLDLQEAGISVTGDLTSRLDGTTTSVVQLRPCGD